MLKRMMIHKAITRNQYVKPFILFEEIEQDGKLCAGSPKTGTNDGPDGEGGDEMDDAKRATFIFDEEYEYE